MNRIAISQGKLVPLIGEDCWKRIYPVRYPQSVWGQVELVQSSIWYHVYINLYGLLRAHIQTKRHQTRYIRLLFIVVGNTST
jgi:hypothetical protein